MSQPLSNQKRRMNAQVMVGAFLSITIMGGCVTSETESEQGFAYKEIPTTQAKAETGVGSSIRFRGNPISLTGLGIHEGEPLREVELTQTDLSRVNIAATDGRVRIISIVPSLDTKVCEQQTHYLSEKSQGLDQSVSLITISVDTPFAQDRFAREARIKNIQFLSDYRGGDFGNTYGLLLEGPHVLARAIMVVDEDNVIRYLQVTPDLGQLPDMEAAFKIARTLSQSPG